MATKQLLQNISRYNKINLHLRTFSSTPASRQQKSLVDINIDAGSAVATLTLNRLPANALSLQLMTDIKKAVEHCEKLDKCRGIILTSASDRIFCAGLDLTEMYKSDEQRLTEFWLSLQNAWLSLFSTTLPTLALINGHATAGGCMFATCCDYRVILPNFWIGLNETKAGVAVPKWVIDTYYHVMPNKRLAEADLLEGRMYKSADALKMGLVDDMANNKAEAFEKCLKFISRYDDVEDSARAATKLNSRSNILKEFEQNRSEDLQSFLKNIQSKSVQEFLGKYLQGLKQKSKK
ncbi:enoyl-CoA delta isomerase 1, mitochondrial-like [Teleopsis dalmanni]|uniref:enoyl-CoA delta isomerase 1, mitochondrial-like n=1 Tax=Teleopsis dalmanni TaxID=139649 RepID=UPI0018CEF4EF|nr:enoyl-CoA delta isomerase 1, mitochondrial-like [Teleopsis dalmanni]